MKIKVDQFIRNINEYCEKNQYFWACGLVKETINLWKKQELYNFLCNEAKMMVDYYKNNGGD